MMDLKEGRKGDENYSKSHIGVEKHDVEEEDVDE